MNTHVSSPDAWSALQEQLRKHGGISVHVAADQRPEPFATVEVVFLTDLGELARASGSVVHIAPDGQISVVFEQPSRDALIAAAFPVGGLPKASPPDAGTAEDDDKRPLWVRYDELSKNEKIKLARQGNAEARRLVARDRDQTLHGFLLQNPGLSANEVAMLVRAGGAGTSFLKRLVQRSDLMGNPRVVEAIVTNPATPIPMAIQLVPRLSHDIVRRIARSGNLREPIVKAARRRVLRT